MERCGNGLAGERMGESSEDGQKRGWLSRLGRHKTLMLVTGLSLAADVASKRLAAMRLADHTATLLETPRLAARFALAHNPAGAWSMFGWAPGVPRRMLFISVSVIASVLLSIWYARTPLQQRLLRFGIAFVLGGALGNLVDRILTGSVIDFVEVSAVWGKTRHFWPTFNIADVAIVLGVGLMAIDMMRPRKTEPQA
jgi:lipoprotein signal peptidase